VLACRCFERAPPRNERMARRQDRVQRLPGAVPDFGRQDRRLRPLRQRSRRAGAGRPGGAAAQVAAERGARTGAVHARADGRDADPADPDRNGLLPADEVFVTGIGSSTTYPDYKPAPFIVASQGRGRGPGHRRHRGHLQLLQLQGEDRHRPLSRPRAGQRALQGRGRGPRHHHRVRLADAVAGRRAPPHRRQQEGRPHDGAS
jgi:hypothetical protein